MFCFFVLVKAYSISPICLQCIMKKALFLRFWRSLLITYLMTSSLEKEIIVLEKSLEKKSWSLDPKICANLDCKTVGFFLKISKEIGKAWRKSRRASEAREKKPTVRFPYNEFVPTRGFKNVDELSKICSQLHPLCEFDTLGDWFLGRTVRFIVSTWLRILTLYPVILKDFLALLLCEAYF